MTLLKSILEKFIITLAERIPNMDETRAGLSLGLVGSQKRTTGNCLDLTPQNPPLPGVCHTLQLLPALQAVVCGECSLSF